MRESNSDAPFRPGAMFIPTVEDSFYWERTTVPLLGRFHQIQLQLALAALLISPACLEKLIFKILQFKFQQAKILKQQKRIGKVDASDGLQHACNPM